MRIFKQISGLFVVIPFFLTSGISIAAPVISPSSSVEVIDGDVYTFSGTSFGTKSNASPVLWDDFDDGISGNAITTGGIWSVDSMTPNPIYQSTDTRTGTGLMVQLHNDKSLTSGNGWLYYHVSEWQTSKKKLLGVWMKVDFIDMNSGHIKVVDMTQGATHASPPGMAEHGLWCYNDGCNDGGETNQSGTGVGNMVYWYSGPPLSLIKSFAFPSYSDDSWVYFLVEYEESDFNTPNGSIKIYQSYPSGAIQTKSSSGGISQSVKGYVTKYVKLRNLLESGALEATAYYDDVYIDDSWARVEIGDQSVYDECTHRELQVPVSWSSTEISINVNTGTFGDGETAYLFVVDPDGTPSPGYSINIASPVAKRSDSGEGDSNTDIIAPVLRVE